MLRIGDIKLAAVQAQFDGVSEAEGITQPIFKINIISAYRKPLSRQAN